MSDQSPSHALDHLTPTQIDLLINRYYSGEKIAALLVEYGINCLPGELYRQFPPEQLGRACPNCGEPLIKLHMSRSSLSTKQRSLTRCSSCTHQEHKGCSCPTCGEKRATEAEELRQKECLAITNFCDENWSYEITHIQPNHLSLEMAVALLSLIRSGGWLNDSIVQAITPASAPFSPNDLTITQDLLAAMIGNDLIAPAPNSPTVAFGFGCGAKPYIDWYAVQWSLRLPSPPLFIKELEILAACNSWPEEWKNSGHVLWKKLAMAECMEFCMHAVTQRKLPMPGQTALTTLFDNLLRTFSVSQCYQLIWNAAGRAVDYMVCEKIKSHHAANTIIGSCQRYADRARAEGWIIKGFHRNFDLPRSQLSYVLHDVFLKHGDTGFFGVISTID